MTSIDFSPRPGALGPESLVSRLRGDTASRSLVDPGLAGGLRDWLEDCLADLVSELGPSALPVRVTKEALNQVLLCEAHHVKRRSGRKVTFELARGVLADALFRQWVTVGAIAHAFDDALAAVSASGDDSIVSFVSSLDGELGRRLAYELDEHAKGITSSWPVPAPGWLARTQDRIEVPLAGGGLVLAGVIDLALGAPSTGRASVCLVEVKSGARRLEHRGDLHFYALLDTLRSGAPPFRIATYYSATGELDAEQVGEDILIGALQRTLMGAERLCRLSSGEEPARSPNPLCAWCSDLPSCAPGQKRAQSRVPKPAGDPRDADGSHDESFWERDT